MREEGILPNSDQFRNRLAFIQQVPGTAGRIGESEEWVDAIAKPLTFSEEIEHGEPFRLR